MISSSTLFQAANLLSLVIASPQFFPPPFIPPPPVQAGVDGVGRTTPHLQLVCIRHDADFNCIFYQWQAIDNLGASCTADSDCKGNGNNCKNGICTQTNTNCMTNCDSINFCKADWDCKGKGKNCKNKQCAQTGTNCWTNCDTIQGACKQDADCKGFGINCINQVCGPASEAPAPVFNPINSITPNSTTPTNSTTPIIQCPKAPAVCAGFAAADCCAASTIANQFGCNTDNVVEQDLRDYLTKVCESSPCVGPNCLQQGNGNSTAAVGGKVCSAKKEFAQC